MTLFANLRTHDKVLDYARFPCNVFHTLVCYVSTEINVTPSHSRSVSPCNDHYKNNVMRSIVSVEVDTWNRHFPSATSWEAETLRLQTTSFVCHFVSEQEVLSVLSLLICGIQAGTNNVATDRFHRVLSNRYTDITNLCNIICMNFWFTIVIIIIIIIII